MLIATSNSSFSNDKDDPTAGQLGVASENDTQNSDNFVTRAAHDGALHFMRASRGVRTWEKVRFQLV